MVIWHRATPCCAAPKGAAFCAPQYGSPSSPKASDRLDAIFKETARRRLDERGFHGRWRLDRGRRWRSQESRDHGRRPRLETPIAVRSRLDILRLDDVAHQRVTVEIGRFKHDGRAVAAGKSAAAGSAVIVGDQDE